MPVATGAIRNGGEVKRGRPGGSEHNFVKSRQESARRGDLLACNPELWLLAIVCVQGDTFQTPSFGPFVDSRRLFLLAEIESY